MVQRTLETPFAGKKEEPGLYKYCTSPVIKGVRGCGFYGQTGSWILEKSPITGETTLGKGKEVALGKARLRVVACHVVGLEFRGNLYLRHDSRLCPRLPT